MVVEVWVSTRGQEEKLRVSENEGLRKIFGPLKYTKTK